MTEPDVDGVDEALALVGGAPTRSAGHPSGPGDTPWDQARAVAARAGRRTAPRARRVPSTRRSDGSSPRR
uniref:hypothetical protein n=1 Tax=Streptomyces somaliensis TaxID=78355 RepID=UPI0037043568